MNEDKATRYHRLKRQAAVLSTVWSAVLLAGALLTGFSLSLRDLAESFVGGSAEAAPAALVVAVYVSILLLIHEAGSLPIAAFSGFVLERRYGLSTEQFGGWLWDQAKAFVIGLVFGIAAASLIYWSIRSSPDNWWLIAGASFALVIVGLTNLAPVLLLPLFYRVTPLARDSLSRRLLELAERAGARVIGTYEWGLGAKTTKANAALAGLGRTRRILVSDTMLKEYTDDEIEVVLAHELAHHVHGDIWKGIVFESALVLCGFYLADQSLRMFGQAAGLRGVSDIAGLPLLALTAGAVSLVMIPVAHALSRALERSADRFALRLTRNPGAFISAMRRLGAQNLAEDNPPRLAQWLFYSHPPLRDRIAAAQAFPVEE